MKIKKNITALVFALILALTGTTSLAAGEGRVVGLDDNVTAYLIGNEETGDIYYEKNADEALPMASLTKLMTFLLVREAIDEEKLA